jgi:hypothetical protein
MVALDQTKVALQIHVLVILGLTVAVELPTREHALHVRLYSI